MASDELTRQLYVRAQKFIDFVEQPGSPIQNSLSHEPGLRDKVTDLKNIAASLGQYSRTDRSFKYVGFVGHFSAGKSSTINSLLGTNARQTALAPTDDEITLLAHPDNLSLLIGAHSKGRLKVSSRSVESETVRNIFVVDTPGSGDPEIIEGMVRDFLPVCDIIVYVFSATNALDQADLPLLQTITERLGFVPMIYAITRADEFRASADEPVSDDNFDLQQQEAFLATLRARLRLHIPRGADATPTYFIDNKSQYGVESLRDALVSETKDIRQLHSSKIAYFQRHLNEVSEYFREYLAGLHKDLSELSATAEANRAEYDNRINLSVQSLHEYWSRLEKQLQTRRNDFATQRAQWLLAAERPATNYKAEWQSVRRVREENQLAANRLSANIQQSVTYAASTWLREKRTLVERRLHDHELADRDLQGSNAPLDRQAIADMHGRGFQDAVNTAIELTRTSLASRLSAEIKQDESALASIAEHATRREILNREAEAYVEYVRIVSASVRDYLPIIQLFKSHVTSATARDLIARTGLAQSLDVLDLVGADPAEADTLTNALVDAVFLERDIARRELEVMSGDLRESIASLRPFLDDFERNSRMLGAQAKAPDAGITAQNASHEIVSVFEAIVLKSEAILNRRMLEWLTTIDEEVKRARARYRRDREESRKGWRSRLGGAAAVGLVVAALLLLVLFYTNTSQQMGVSLTVLTGVAAQVLATAVVWGGIRLFRAKGRWFTPTQFSLLSEEKEAIIAALGTVVFEPDESLTTEFAGLPTNLLSRMSHYVANDGQHASPAYQSIFSAERKVIAERSGSLRKYIKGWSAFLDKMSVWYRDDEPKKARFKQLASDLKQRSIEPALALFSARLEHTRHFQNQMDEYRF